MTLTFATLFISLLLVACASQQSQQSAYLGQQNREIKALSPTEIEGLLAGKGLGYAKSAELNGYPGPAHVLELADKLGLSPEQLSKTTALFGRMETSAKQHGARLIQAEKELESLQQNRKEVASSYASVSSDQATSLLMQLHSMAEGYSQSDSYLCKKGKRSNFPPPPDIFDAIERDHASTCNCFKSLRSQLPKALSNAPPGFGFTSLLAPPNLTSLARSGPAEAIGYFRARIDRYTEAVKQIKVHQIEAKPPLYLSVMS